MYICMCVCNDDCATKELATTPRRVGTATTAVPVYKSGAKADCDCIDMQCCPCLSRRLHFPNVYLFVSLVDWATPPLTDPFPSLA